MHVLIADNRGNRDVLHDYIFSYDFRTWITEPPLDFHADYILSQQGDKWVAPGARILLLHVRSGVHLVLIDGVVQRCYHR